jgi:hypothetical protein
VKVCAVPGCPTLTAGRRCTAHQAEAERARGTRQQRGYGAQHDVERRAWMPRVLAGDVLCSRCGLLILPTEPWQLDHTDDRASYRGPSHPLCNAAAGGRAAHRQ